MECGNLLPLYSLATCREPPSTQTKSVPAPCRRSHIKAATSRRTPNFVFWPLAVYIFETS